jgi:hypothetical protein
LTNSSITQKKDGRKKEQVSQKQEKLRQKLEADPEWAADYRERRAKSSARFLERKKEKERSMGMIMMP